MTACLPKFVVVEKYKRNMMASCVTVMPEREALKSTDKDLKERLLISLKIIEKVEADTSKPDSENHPCQIIEVQQEGPGKQVIIK